MKKSKTKDTNTIVKKSEKNPKELKGITTFVNEKDNLINQTLQSQKDNDSDNNKVEELEAEVLAQNEKEPKTWRENLQKNGGFLFGKTGPSTSILTKIIYNTHTVATVWLIFFGFFYFDPKSQEINGYWRYAFLASFFKNIARISDLGLMSYHGDGGKGLTSQYIHNASFSLLYLYLFISINTDNLYDYKTIFYYFFLGILIFYISLFIFSRALSDHSFGFWMQGSHVIDMTTSLLYLLMIFVVVGAVKDDFSDWWLIVPLVSGMAILATFFALAAKIFIMIGLCFKAFWCIMGFTVYTSGIVAIFALKIYISVNFEIFLWLGILFLGYFNTCLTYMNIQAVFSTYGNLGTSTSERVWNEVQEEGMNVILGYTGLDTIKDAIDLAGWVFGTQEEAAPTLNQQGDQKQRPMIPRISQNELKMMEKRLS